MIYQPCTALDMPAAWTLYEYSRERSCGLLESWELERFLLYVREEAESRRDGQELAGIVSLSRA
jgi:hypothetical protein